MPFEDPLTTREPTQGELTSQTTDDDAAPPRIAFGYRHELLSEHDEDILVMKPQLARFSWDLCALTHGLDTSLKSASGHSYPARRIPRYGS